MLATELQDLLLGNPQPIRAKVNIGLGVLRPDYVNVAVHGHDPLLADALAQASYDPEIIEEAKRVGAKGINLSESVALEMKFLCVRGYLLLDLLFSRKLLLQLEHLKRLLLMCSVSCKM